MHANSGYKNNLLRMAPGVALIAVALFVGLALFDGAVWNDGITVVVLMLMATAALRFCAFYTPFGTRTCRT